MRKTYLIFICVLFLFLGSGCISSHRNISSVTLQPVSVGSKATEKHKGEASNKMLCLSCKAKLIGTDVSGLVRSFQWKGKNIVVFCGSDLIELDGRYISLPQPVECKTDMVMVSPTISNYIRNLNWIGKKVKIMIDPGHGGKDPGAVAGGVKEKDIVLDVARKLYSYLRSYGIDVQMTRKDDTFISLRKRAEKTNKYMPDLFVSIHANSSPRSSGCGIEVYYVSEKVDDISRAVVARENSVLQASSSRLRDPTVEVIVWDMIYTDNRCKSRRLAKIVAQNISRVMNSPNRGAKGGPFYVLKWVNVPAILVEIGFLSNPKERAKLMSDAYRNKIAKAIAEGIREYLNGAKDVR